MKGPLGPFIAYILSNSLPKSELNRASHTPFVGPELFCKV